MKPVNKYALIRISDPQRLERLERHMSGRNRFLKIKPWETDGLRAFSLKLDPVMEYALRADRKGVLWTAREE